MGLRFALAELAPERPMLLGLELNMKTTTEPLT